MEIYETLEQFDLKTSVSLIATEYGGRQGPVFDGYRGQFFWHINNVNCADWDASYTFEKGSMEPGDEGFCKVRISDNLKKYSKGDFPVGSQFSIREGARVIAVGVILENRCNSA